MLISRSLGRKALVMTTAAAGFVMLLDATVIDSRIIQPAAAEQVAPAEPTAGARLRFTTTAYCKGTTTASGVNVRTGIAAADPDLLPVGSVIQVDSLGERYNGIYTIMDTGPAVQGRHIDIYMWSCNEALALGRRDATITILRLGWNPRASAPRLINRLFRQREKAQH
jgi:3D (Asp-Asp-Asp) domain-containing protein